MNDLLARLISDQQGLILRRQALELGLTDEAIEWRVTRGLWRRVYRGLYATFPGAPSDEQRMIAATLLAGPGSQITGVAALRWHGLRYLPDDQRVHVLTRLGPRRGSPSFIVISRSGRLDPHPFRGPVLEVCSVARAGADAARAGYSRRDVRAFLSEMVQRRRTTVDLLDAEWRAGPIRGSKQLGAVLEEVRAGVLSAPEAELRALTNTSVILPPIVWNPVLAAADGTRLPTPDGWIEDVGLALEVDSDEFHTSAADIRLTRERDHRMAIRGILALHFAPREIREEPQRVLATIETTYAGRQRGFTGVRAIGVAFSG